ncbi:MAG TPA: LysR substrate-binding domain-containing protein [Nitrosomonas sp.]|nr:LysR substrate-binding domain-containing protein [Nitrosomonas sp.]
MAETVRLEMPEVQLSTTEAMTGHLREWIMKGEVDLALLCDNASFGDCASSLLVTEDLRFYSTDEDRPLSTPPEEPADLTDVAATDLVLPSEKDGLCIFIERAARATAWLAERDFVTPEDVQKVAADALRHRILLNYEAEAEGITTQQCIDQILVSVPAP